MFLLLFFLFLALGVSFLCSIMESVLLSVTPSFVETYKKKHPKAGKELENLKKDIDRPLAAILSLNTVAHTVGAAGVGAEAMIIFGEASLAIISAILTLLILVLSEIIPKTLGAIYWRRLTGITVHALRFFIILMHPLVLLSQKITGLLVRNREVQSISREEIKAIVDIGYKEGSIRKEESVVLENLMRFGSLMVEDIMTPRPVMFILPDNLTLGEVMEEHPELNPSRIPIFHESREQIEQYVLRNDILLHVSKNETDKRLKEIGRDLLIVPEIISLRSLFEKLLKKREHIALAIDEYGGVAGLVTLEDIVETLIGIEIVDEYDENMDMQKLARDQWIKRAKRLGLITRPDELDEWLQK